MKTIEELYKVILADNDLKAQCIEAIKANKLDEFLKAQGCDATIEDVKAFLESRKEAAPDELDATAGGCNEIEAVISSLTVGVLCAFLAIGSAALGEEGAIDYGDGSGSVLCPGQK